MAISVRRQLQMNEPQMRTKYHAARFERNSGSLQVLLEDSLTHFDFSFHKQMSSHDTRHVVFAL